MTEGVDAAVFSARIAAGVSTTSLMMAVDVFLLGALLAAKGASPRTYSAPLLLLVVSALGFLYGTLMYANSHRNLRSKSKFERQMDYANVVSEALGVCALVLAVPLAVAAVTHGAGLRWSVFVISMIAFAGYQLSRYSLLRRYLHGCGSALLLVLLVAFDLVSFLLLQTDRSTALRIVSAATIASLLAGATFVGFLVIACGRVQND